MQVFFKHFYYSNHAGDLVTMLPHLTMISIVSNSITMTCKFLMILSILRWSNGLLSKARHQIVCQDDIKSGHIINNKTLISLYYSVFNSVLTYGCQTWGLLNNTSLQKVIRLQKSAMRIISFSNFQDHTNPIFEKLKILKFEDYLTLQNVLFVHDFIHEKLPCSFENFFIKKKDCNIKTRAATIGEITAPKYNQVKYGRKSLTHTCVFAWNKFSHLFFCDTDITSLSRNQLKKKITKFFLDQY